MYSRIEKKRKETSIYKIPNHKAAYQWRTKANNLTMTPQKISLRRRASNGMLLFFQKTRMLQSRDVVTLFHLFTIATYVWNCFDMQH